MRNLHALALLLIFLSVSVCLVVAETSPSPGSSAGTGIEGVITISPIQGGPIRQGVPDSKPLPNMAFVVRKGTEDVAAFETDAQGRFHVALPPGKYQVLARDQKHKFGGWGPFPVEVAAGKMTQKNFDCDSGLR